MNANWNRGRLRIDLYNGSLNILLHGKIGKKMRIIVKMTLMTCLGLIVNALTGSYLYQPIMRIPEIVGGHKSECRYVIYYM
jgi:hypothetical protein